MVSGDFLKKLLVKGKGCLKMQCSLVWKLLYYGHIDYLQMNVKAEEENNQARPDLVKS